MEKQTIVELNKVNYMLTAKLEKASVLWVISNIVPDGKEMSSSTLLPFKYIAQTIASWVNHKDMPDRDDEKYNGSEVLSRNYYKDFSRYERKSKFQIARIGKYLNSNVLPEFFGWIEANSDPIIFAIQRKAMALLGTSGNFSLYKNPESYDKYWAKDALRMNSAHYFASVYEVLLNHHNLYEPWVRKYNEQYIYARFVDLDKWQDVILGTEPTKAQRRTFSNCPRSSLEAFAALRFAKISKPITWWVRLELIATIKCGTEAAWIELIENSTDEQIRTAINIAARKNLTIIDDWRKRRNILRSINWIGYHANQVLELVENGFDICHVVENCDQVPQQTVTPLEIEEEDYLLNGFAIPLPPHWKQIMTKKELIEEGREMHHCCGSYAPYCRDGEYFVFSIREGDQRVTLGIDRDHNFNQCFSYCNEKNELAFKVEEQYKKILNDFSDSIEIRYPVEPRGYIR